MSVEDVVLLDIPPALRSERTIESLNILRDRGQRIVAVDGPDKNIDLLLIPSFLVHDDLQSRNEAGLLNLIWGWDALLIDQRRGVAPRLPGAPILVLTGGSDALGLGSRLPRILDNRLERGTAVTWVVGPQAIEPWLPKAPRIDWTILRDVHDLRPAIMRAGHALSVYGVSTLELLHHGVPSVAYSPYGARDLLELNVLENEGLALTARDEVGAVEKLLQLIGDPALADWLAQNGASTIQQSGIEKVVDAILKLFSQT
jgi:glycosyltransferase involved in cell wall biosynthesis